MMLGTRTAAWAKSGYTAKDYVQDGLKCLCDSMENGGYGVLDKSITQFVDCASGLNIKGMCSWEEKGLLCKSNVARLHEPQFSFESDATITSVIETEDYGWWLWSLGGMYAMDGHTGSELEAGPHISGRAPIFCTMTSYSGSVYGRISGSIPKGTPCEISLVWHGATRTYEGYLNGTLVGHADVSADMPSETTKWRYSLYESLYASGESPRRTWIKNHRMYLRALTAAEIAANYKIDKARFNIQDAT